MRSTPSTWPSSPSPTRRPGNSSCAFATPSTLPAENGTVRTSPRDHLERAVAGLEAATIDTLHGFCREILRAQPLAAGIDPSFEVEGSGARMLSRSFRSWWAEALVDPDPGLRRFLARGRVLGWNETPSSELEAAVAGFLDHRDLDGSWSGPEADLEALWAELEPRCHRLAEHIIEGEVQDPLRTSLEPWLEALRGLSAADAPESAEARRVQLGPLLKQALARPMGTGPL